MTSLALAFTLLAGQASAPSMDPRVRDFPGFAFAGAERRVPTPFLRYGLATPAPAGERAVPAKIRVVVCLRTSEVIRTPSGLIVRRGTFEEPDEKRVEAALARFSKIVAPQVAATLNVSKEVEAIAVGEGESLSGAIERTVRPLINEGRYEDEDGIDRGPFTAVVAIVPTTDAPVVLGTPGRTPLAIVPFGTGMTGDGAFDRSLFATVLAAIGGTVSEPIAEFPASSVAVGEGYAVEPGKDGDRDFLRIVERGYFRGDGLALPAPASGRIDAPSLKMTIRSDSPYPTAIGVVGADGTRRFVALGTDGEAPGPDSPVVPFRYDGSWQTVTVPLGGPATGVSVGPTPRMVLSERRARGPVTLDIARIETTDEAPAPSPTAPSFVPNDAVKGLASEDFRVRLNAADRLRTAPKPDAADAIALIVNDLVPEVGVAAVGALEAAKAIPQLEKVVKSGLNDRVRAAAGVALARVRPDKTTLLALQPLFANRAWRTRMAAVEAAALVPGPTAGIFRMSLIGQEDPRIKLRVTELADPTVDYEARKLLYSVVNEPWDEVRLASAIKLLDSKNDAFVAEALKAVRDDSVGVRRRFTAHLAGKGAYKSTLRIALADKDPYVRAAGLDGLAALPGGDPEALTSILADRDPDVQLAVIRYAIKTGTALPPETRKALAESPDPRVREAQRALPERA